MYRIIITCLVTLDMYVLIYTSPFRLPAGGKLQEGWVGLRLAGRDAFDLDSRTESQAIRAESAARRIPPGEVGPVHLVEGVPLRDVRQHHRAFHHIIDTVAVRF